MPTELKESRPLQESVAAKQPSGPRKMRIRIIEGDRWGSSGYYPKEVLERDGPTAFPAGTQMYLDHPGEEESYDRPERSVRDLAARTITDAVYENGDLYADIEVYSHTAPIISEMAEDIGVSIRGFATFEEGEREGRKGPIITKLVEGISVDFVTKAGAGGRIVELLESARKSAEKDNTVPKEIKLTVEEGEDFSAVMEKARKAVYEATASNRRRQLSEAVAEAYRTQDTWVWVRDFDETQNQVWFDVESSDQSTIYQQSWEAAADDASVTLLDDRTEVRIETRYVPVGESAADNPTQTRESKPMPEISEARLRELEESATARDDLAKQLEEAQAANVEADKKVREAEERAQKAEARRIVADEMREAGVTGKHLSASLAAYPPLKESGDVDEEKLRERVQEALGEISVQVEEAEGGVRGFGPRGQETEITEADIEKKQAALFGRSVS